MPLVFVFAVVLTMVLLMRNRVLKEKYAVWWAVVSIAVLVGRSSRSSSSGCRASWGS